MGKAVKHQSYRKFLFGLVAILLAGTISLVGCSAPATNPPPSTQTAPAVPQRADLLGRVALAEILADEDFAELYQEIAAQDTTLPQTLDAALDVVEYQTGINLRDFTNVTVFADATALVERMESAQSNGAPSYCGALVEGELDESTFIDSIESKLGRELTTSIYQNYTIHTFPDSQNQSEAFSMAFLADNEMVIGTTLAVKDVIDVAMGRQEPISGTVYDLYSQLGDALIKLASSVPESLTERIPAEISLGPINLNLLCFRDIEYATLTLTENGAIVNTDVHLEFANVDSARTSEQLLRLAITSGKHIVSDPDIKELLSKVHISRSGSSVSLTLALTIPEIEHLISAMLEEAKVGSPHF